jgi:peroxiredoxin
MESMRNVNGSKNVLGYFAAGVFALAFAGAPAAQAQSSAGQPAKVEHQDKAHKDKAGAAAKVGQRAPDFTLVDTDGKEHKLSSSSGKIIVIEWFNPDCPFVKKHHTVNPTFNDMYTKYAKDVQFYAINSGAPGMQGAGKDRNVKAKTEFNLQYPILLDETGEVGKAYGARNTPAMYVIAADGTLAYAGAIDDDNSPETAGKTNYVTKALDELLAKKPVTTSETTPYGCSVKYAK